MATSHRPRSKQRNLHQDYQDVFGTDAGKAVLDDLEKASFMHRTTYDPNPIQMGINEGLRMAILRIKHFLNSKPIEEDGTDD